MPAPKLPTYEKTVTAYKVLWKKAKADPNIHAGRNLLTQGNKNGEKVSPAKLRAATIKLWRANNPKVIQKYFKSNTYLYDVNRNLGVRAMVETYFDQIGLDEGSRSVWRCIIKNESDWRPTVWNGGLEGWQPRYIGTVKVVGLMQMRPYHADNVYPNRTVSYATYVKLSDPVFAIQKGLRLGLGPFFAQAGNCF